MKYLKQCWPYLLAFVIFVVVACLYMSPAMDGKVINTSDGVQGRAAVHEAVTYYEQTGDRSWWTGSMFSGMPNFQIGGGKYLTDQVLSPLKNILLWGHRNVLAIVVIYCIGFFALLRSMKVDTWLSVVGALAIAFSSYFFIIIGANHHSKTSTLALMSLALAGFYLIYNGHRKTGVCLTMLGTMAGFYPHPQMSYYICFIFAAFGVAELSLAAMHKTWKAFALNTLIAAVAFGIGVGTGTANTFANLEYADETMRGGHSDLEQVDDAQQKTKGLDLDYATNWSYGIDECWTFLIPNYFGGSSNYNIGAESDLCKDMVKKGLARKQAEQICQSVPTYWGDQPFTAGPVYMGAIVCLLFVLGLFIVKGPYKWAILAVTLLTIFLSWGHHWMGLTRFFFEHFPMYNKFRAVSSILVVAEITMPLLGFLALQQLVKTKEALLSAATLSQPYQQMPQVKSLSRQILISAGILVFLLLVALFTTSGFSAAIDAQLPDWFTPMMKEARQSLFRTDVWRSMGFVVAGAAVLYIYMTQPKFRSTAVLAGVLGALVLFDMWPVDKRYMNDSMFVPVSNFDKQFKAQAWERQILEAEGMKVEQPNIVTDNHFRVFNLAMNPFNDARTSYRLKSIGGYSAAKLRRYQDLIDQHLSKVHLPVISMLNARYLIVPNQEQGGVQIERNPDALGNAWFVDSLVVAQTPNEECDGLMKYDLSHVAVVGKDFVESAPSQLSADSTASIRLTQYTPESVEYDAQCSAPGTVVFSEIYYPYGWKAYIDDAPVSHYRVNYMLRALNLEPGKHHIRFEFRPDSVTKGNTISMVFVSLMFLIIIGCIAKGVIDLRKISVDA